MADGSTFAPFIDAPGLYDMPEDAYHADPVLTPSLSSGLARTLLTQSPLHAWTASRRLNPDYESGDRDAFDIGKVVHRLVLGKGSDFEVIRFDDWRTKEAKQQRDDARAAGRTPILAKNFDAAMEMAAKAHRMFASLGVTFRSRRNEQVAVALIDDCWCRAMVDHPEDDPAAPLYDYKTTEDASPAAVIRSIANYGYDVQARHYQEVWHGATGQRRGFRFVFQEKRAPFSIQIVELLDARGNEADWVEDSAQKTATARMIWRRCVAANQWPDYPPRVLLVGAPSYHRAAWGRAEPVIPPEPSAIAEATRWQSPSGL